MDWILPGILAVLLLILAVLCLQVYLLRKSAGEIRAAFQDRLTADTNTPILISSRDPAMRRLAADINAQLRLLRSQRQRYETGDREVKEAVANLSHDLRTPLTAICGYLELMEGQNLPPDARRYLAQIENRTQAMRTLTEELFRYALVVSEQTLHPQPVDLRRVLEETLLSFYGAFAQNQITPSLCLAEPPEHFLLDQTALHRVLDNILANALKYSAGDLRVCLEASGQITFINRAPGLDAVAVARLFDRYYTVASARNATGLGLSIARRLTEQMGGGIEASYADGCLTVKLDFSQTRIAGAARPEQSGV